MNPVFWFLVILLLVLVWFLLGVVYKAIGAFLMDLLQNAVDGMTEENQTEKMEDENK